MGRRSPHVRHTRTHRVQYNPVVEHPLLVLPGHLQGRRQVPLQNCMRCQLSVNRVYDKCRVPDTHCFGTSPSGLAHVNQCLASLSMSTEPDSIDAVVTQEIPRFLGSHVGARNPEMGTDLSETLDHVVKCC